MLEVVAVSLVAGVLIGWLWPAIAPEVVGQVTAEGEIGVSIAAAAEYFPREAVLAALASGTGAVLSLYYAVRFRMRPVTTVLALPVGGAAGTAVAVFVGRLVGPGDAATRAAQAGVGDELVMPLTLHAHGLLVAWPLVATIVGFAVALVRDDRSPWGAPSLHPRRIDATTADVR